MRQETLHRELRMPGAIAPNSAGGVRGKLLSVSLLFLGLVGCYDAPRTNPFDPALTPAVELLSVTVDNTSGSATLEWTPYEGKQPFAEYRVLRKVPGLEAVDTVAAIADVRQTVFRDTTLRPDVPYGYWVEVVNQGGFDVESGKREGTVYALPSIELLEAKFSSDTATAELVWTQYRGPGFEAYEVRRKAPELEEKVVAEIESVSDTTYTDTFLDGNTEYTYHISVRTEWEGVGILSNERSGIFYPFDHAFDLPKIPDTEPRAVALAVDEQDQLYIARTMQGTKNFNANQPMKKGVQVDFLSTGRKFLLFSEVRPDRESPVHLVAGQGRVYVSVRSDKGATLITALSESGQELWTISVDTEGVFPVGLYLEENGNVIMGDDRGSLYLFDSEGIVRKLYNFQATLERSRVQSVGQMMVGPRAGFEGGDQFFVLDPDQQNYHVHAVSRRPKTEVDFRASTAIHIDEGIGLEKGQTLTPVALAFDPQRQRLLVLEVQGRLQVFDGQYETHRYITQWGRSGTGEGEFLIFRPTGAAMVVDSQGMIYVVDGSNRIQVFAP